MEAVGVGCLWFAVNPDTYDDEKFSPITHLKEIEKALESVDNVSSVKITGKGDRTSHIGILDDDEDDDGVPFFPIYSDVEIEFDIFVPLRLQKKYTRGRTADNVETFRVKIRYDSMPVACVHYSVEGSATNARQFQPSNAVVSVRKYLADKLAGHPTIRFGTLGPSPFHADIFLEPAGELKPGAEQDLSSLGDGYKTFHFVTEATTADDAVREFSTNTQPILAAYYLVVRARNQTSRLTHTLTSGARDLLLPPKAKSWSRLLYWTRLRDEIDSVYGALLDEKMNRVYLASFHKEIQEDERIPSNNVLYKFIEREMKPPDNLPGEDIRELLMMLEQRRRGYFQNTATLIAGLAGGILGAILGAALTYVVSSQSNPSSNPSASPSTTQSTGVLSTINLATVD